MFDFHWTLITDLHRTLMTRIETFTRLDCVGVVEKLIRVPA
jgi:hypothetical protein